MSVFVSPETGVGYCGKGNNFNSEWMKYYLHAKFAPADYEFKSGDVNISWTSTTSDFHVVKTPGVKNIMIVGEIDRASIESMNSADHVIFLNPLQKAISDTFGNPNIPCTVLPSYPLNNFGGNIIKKPKLYIGGRGSQKSIDALVSKLVTLHKTFASDVEFQVFINGTDKPEIKESIGNLEKDLKSSVLNGNRIVRLDYQERIYEHMLFNIRTSKYLFLWKSGSDIGTVANMVRDKDDSILDIPIGESAMLAHGISAKCDIISDNNVNYISKVDTTPRVTFKEFAAKMNSIIT